MTKISSCDAEHPSLYYNSNGDLACTCIVCGRCRHHTGNNTQGHFWKMCRIARRYHNTHTSNQKYILDCEECMPEWHLCCPNDCEIFNEDGTRKNA